MKLHRLLDDAEVKAFDDIIAWSSNGTSFRVFSKERFEDEVMGVYFESNKYKSFQRTLNLWGFQVRDNKLIVNDNFVRGKVQLCALMKRIKIKGAYQRRHKSPPGTGHTVNHALTPTLLMENKGESIPPGRMSKPIPPNTSSEMMCQARPKVLNEQGINFDTKVFNASVSSRLQAVFDASSEPQPLLSFIVNETNNRCRSEFFSGSHYHSQHRSLTAAIEILRNNGTGRPYHSDLQHRLPSGFEGTSKFGMLHQQNFTACTSDALLQAFHKINLQHSSRMAINRSAALTLQSSIDNAYRQRLIAAYEKAAASFDAKR
jgi:hypothetical protein